MSSAKVDLIVTELLNCLTKAEVIEVGNRLIAHSVRRSVVEGQDEEEEREQDNA
jgi:hypothetical protein